jgi:hypothetical protein
MYETERSEAKVLSFAAFSTEKKATGERRRLKTAKATEIASSFHIDITGNGEIKTKPIQVTQAHALAMLEIFIAISAHLVEVYQGTGSS